MLTQARLKEVLSYDPLTGVFVSISQPGKRADLLGAVVGVGTATSYGHITIDGRSYKAHRLAWLYMHGVWPTDLLDHENLNKGDNRFKNLREADRSQNEQNKLPRCHNTSGVTGVYWNKCASKWQAYIKLDGRVRYLGIFVSFDEAAATRRKAEIDLFGDFAPRKAA